MNTLKTEIANILKDLGVSANLRGYVYLRRAVELALALPDANRLALTKLLYPQIAAEFDTTPSGVERTIRHAIEVSCNRGSEAAFNQIFRYSYSARRGKPTNSEYVATIADYIKLKGEQ